MAESNDNTDKRITCELREAARDAFFKKIKSHGLSSHDLTQKKGTGKTVDIKKELGSSISFRTAKKIMYPGNDPAPKPETIAAFLDWLGIDYLPYEKIITPFRLKNQ